MAKVVKGGRRFSFTALVVVGDEVDRVGVGYGKAREVPLAITKAVEDAKKNLFTIPKHGTTITHEVLGRFDAAQGAAAPGLARERASSPAAACARCSSSAASATCSRRASARRTRSTWLKATVAALQDLRRPEDVARIRGKRISEVLPLAAAPEEELEAGAAPVAAAIEEASAPAEAAPEEEAPLRSTLRRTESLQRRSRQLSRRCRDRRAACRFGGARSSRYSSSAGGGGEAEAEAPHAAPKEGRLLMPRLRVTQVRSQIGQSERHRGTLRALGLGRIGRSAEHEESPTLAGMLRKVRHLVKIENA